MLKLPIKQARKRVNTLLGLTPPKDQSIGVIDSFTEDTLTGWFIARMPGAEGNRFMLFLDELALGTFEAVLPRPDLLALKGVQDCGYQIALKPLLEALPRGIHTLHDGGQHRLILRTIRGRMIAEKLVTGRSPLRGFFDKLDETGLQGWAVDESAPEQPVELSLYVNNVHYQDLRTSLPRGDLTAKGLAGSQAGFRHDWPVGLLPPGSIIDIRFRNSGQSLSKSPRTVEGPAASRIRSTLGNLDAWQTGQMRDVTVIVPIFNAYEAVSDCLQSLERTLPVQARVLLMDDASPDPRMAELLAKHADQPGWQVVTNESNLGYTRTVNKAIGLCSPNDVVLLNSDTVTTSRWLQNLRHAAYSQPRVATVTALSDHAGAFSAPEIGTANPISPHLDRDTQARLIVQAQEGRLLEVPTGNGFCFYMRRSAIEALGTFDETKFPRGYGEENDFCMRALRNGWINLVCDKAYVLHKRSQSFQGEKEMLMEAGASQLRLDYPEYRLLTQRFRDAEFTHVRYLARAATHRGTVAQALPRVLYVISTQTGGTPQTNMDLMRSMKGRYQCYLLHCDARTITWSVLSPDSQALEVLETHTLAQPITPVTHRSAEYDRVVLDLLYRHSIDLVHIRHIGWHSLGLAEAARSIGLPVIYSSHDFYALCPSLNLLDEQMKHCGGQCPPGEGTCQIALWPISSLPMLKHQFIHRWQDMMGEFLSHCSHVITTTESAAQLLRNRHPGLQNRLSVIPHGRDFDEFRLSTRRPMPGGRIKVLVPGNISPSKGAMLLRDMATRDANHRLEFHFLGKIWDGLKGIGVHHGPYERTQFATKVDAIAPHLGLVLSIWPETYCHTLTEMWACGLPVMGFAIGAVGDRLHASGAGWPIPLDLSAADVVNRLIAAADDVQGFETRMRAVMAWQSTEGTWNTTATMSMAYRQVYHSLLNPRQPPRQRVGLVVKGANSASHPATAHIRLLRTLTRLPDHDMRVVDPAWLLAGGSHHVDLLVIQRDAVPAALALPLIEQLRQQGLPFVYEIDDLLWQLPEDHTDHGIDAAQQAAIEQLMRAAAVVTTSTPVLAEAIGAYNDQVVVMPNALDSALWLQPLDDMRLTALRTQHQLDPQRPRLLYMGTRSHAADLALIAEAVEEVVRLHPDLDVIQIGGGTPLPHARLLTPPKDCTAYPEFVGWFRHIAATATMAVAPLADTPFNQAKSDIKTLDYGLARVPAVFSRVGPYQTAVTHGRTGLLCDNAVGPWVQAMRQLLSDAALRDEIRSAAFERACDRSRNAYLASTWQQLIDKALAPQGADRFSVDGPAAVANAPEQLAEPATAALA
ncbi:MAG: hypothetical protein RLZZ592_1266 [Pseudomonadota bacterium]|jgi:GT2 family glycosyltransferase/glycosyltransferase involved in cell wall biosynthesis